MRVNRTRAATPPGLRRVRLAVAALALAGAAAEGCSTARRAAPDPETARATVQAALDGWKRGDPPSSLESASPPIVVQDLDWIAGARLVDYRWAGDGRAVAATYYVPVSLTVQLAGGRPVRRNVSYIVGNGRMRTVHRAFP